MADRPRELRLLGRTRDGRALVLETAGERFVLPVDEAALAAMGAPAPELVEPVVLTPREIQDRIRHGESSAVIAVDTGMALAAVERFEGPVLGERALQAERAGSCLVRGISLADRVAAYRRPVDAGPLAALPEPPSWDAWLEKEGGTWRILVSWPAGYSASWRWRPQSRAVQPLDAVARSVSDEPAGRQDDLEAVLRPLRAADAPVAPVTALRSVSTTATRKPSPAPRYDEDARPAAALVERPAAERPRSTLAVTVTQVEVALPEAMPAQAAQEGPEPSNPRHHSGPGPMDSGRGSPELDEAEAEPGEPAQAEPREPAQAEPPPAEPVPAATRRSPAKSPAALRSAKSARSNRATVPSWDEITGEAARPRP